MIFSKNTFFLFGWGRGEEGVAKQRENVKVLQNYILFT